ncbi:MAG: GTP-binding protein [Candidatus Thermoplasmatota archaeon]|jgi:sulfate adenylyltransferase subunit 1|nr:GTP-binding protein [Candidatus Thermoplasmatota archaeon]
MDEKTYLNMDLLRFTTAGSVDDGKSTLIGRLLYDSKTLFEDQLENLERVSQQRGEELNLALLTDGLRAEREQGITIDVAYRYFATPVRKFIIADTPGHIQYTRNMVTGASTANLALILVDARNGVTEQTHRHIFIASLLQIPHFVICINKMDLVEYNQEVYERIKAEIEDFISKLTIPDITFIPISALLGDNVVNASTQMTWYHGPTLLYHLEDVHIGSDENLVDCRFPVQYVIRPRSDKYHDYRGYAGRIASGIFKPGDNVTILPSGFTTTIKTIEGPQGILEEAFPPMSVVMQLDDDLDISRGDMLVRSHNIPFINQDIDCMVCWMNAKPLNPGTRYIIRHTTRELKGIVKEIQYRIDINTLHRVPEVSSLGLNEIGRITIRTAQPLFFDSYEHNRSTGSIILVDETTNETVGAGMIREPSQKIPEKKK